MKYYRFAFLLFIIFLVACNTKKKQQGLNPQDALSSFRVADGFKIEELVASEPMISDPVAMDVDENGNMYVVEMHGYPSGYSRFGKNKITY